MNMHELADKKWIFKSNSFRSAVLGESLKATAHAASTRIKEKHSARPFRILLKNESFVTLILIILKHFHPAQSCFNKVSKIYKTNFQTFALISFKI